MAALRRPTGVIAAAVLALGLGGCGYVNRGVAEYTGVVKTCFEGVPYLQFPSGATVQMDRAGKPVPCGRS